MSEPKGWKISRILEDGTILRAPIGENAPARKGWWAGNRVEPAKAPALSPLEQMAADVRESETYRASMPTEPVNLSTRGLWPAANDEKKEEVSMSSQETTVTRAQILERRKIAIYGDPHFTKSDPLYRSLLEELQGIQREQAGMGTSKT